MDRPGSFGSGCRIPKDLRVQRVKIIIIATDMKLFSFVAKPTTI